MFLLSHGVPCSNAQLFLKPGKHSFNPHTPVLRTHIRHWPLGGATGRWLLVLLPLRARVHPNPALSPPVLLGLPSPPGPGGVHPLCAGTNPLTSLTGPDGPTALARGSPAGADKATDDPLIVAQRKDSNEVTEYVHFYMFGLRILTSCKTHMSVERRSSKEDFCRALLTLQRSQRCSQTHPEANVLSASDSGRGLLQRPDRGSPHNKELLRARQTPALAFSEPKSWR